MNGLISAGSRGERRAGGEVGLNFDDTTAATELLSAAGAYHDYCRCGPMTAAMSISPASDHHLELGFGKMIREPRANSVPPLPPTLGLSRHIFYDISYSYIRATGVGVTSDFIWM